MLQFIHNRNIGSSCQLPSLFSSYSLRELDRSNYLKNGGVLLGFNNVGDLLIGYSCSTIPNTTNSIQISYCFSLLVTTFHPPLPFKFFELPILPTITTTPSLPIHIIPTSPFFLIYHYSLNTLHLTILSPSTDSFPLHFLITNISQPFSLQQNGYSIQLITATDVLIVYLYAQITTFDSQVNAVDNILTIDLSKHYKTIKATGFVLNSNPITKIRHIKASPQHIILPFTCDKISYQTINIDGNTFYRKKQYYTTTKTDDLQEEHFENIVSAKNYCKTFLLNHYSSEKLTHPFRYTSLLSNSTTFSGKTVPALTHPSGIYLTF